MGNEAEFYDNFCPVRQGDGKYPQNSVIFDPPAGSDNPLLEPDDIPNDSSAIIIALTADLNIDESMSDEELKRHPWTVILPVHERIVPSKAWGISENELSKYHFFEELSQL